MRPTINAEWRPIVQGVVTTLFGAAIGFGVSQATLATTVAVVAHEEAVLKQADADLRGDLNNMRAAETAHMTEAIGLVKEVIKANSEFVAIVKVQNELLMRDKK